VNRGAEPGEPGKSELAGSGVSRCATCAFLMSDLAGALSMCVKLIAVSVF